MKATFADLMQIGFSGPYNLSKLRFRIHVDVQGAYHLSQHAGVIMAKGVTHTQKSGAEVFSNIAPCCAAKSQFICYSNDGWDMPRELSAYKFVSKREKILDTLTQSQALKEADTDALTIFESITSLCDHGFGTLDLFQASALSACSGWGDKYQKDLKKELTKQVKLFKTKDAKPMLEKFITKVIKEKTFSSVNSTVEQALKKAYEVTTRDQVANRNAFYLSTRIDGYRRPPSWAEAIFLLYETNIKDVFSIPFVVAEALTQKGMIRVHAETSGALDPKTLEALKVLYQPASDGPYSDLASAYQAAKLL